MCRVVVGYIGSQIGFKCFKKYRISSSNRCVYIENDDRIELRGTASIAVRHKRANENLTNAERELESK